MMKRLLSLLLTLAILLGAMPGLAETAVPVLRSAEIASLKTLAGDAQAGADEGADVRVGVAREDGAAVAVALEELRQRGFVRDAARYGSVGRPGLMIEVHPDLING